MVSYKRHFAKTISWRIIGTLDTFLLSWFITGNIKIGATIGGVEVITKMILYFFHERKITNAMSMLFILKLRWVKK